MCPLLYYLPLIQDQDAIHLTDSGKTMGDNDGGTLAEEFLYCLLDKLLCMGVNTGGSLI